MPCSRKNNTFENFIEMYKIFAKMIRTLYKNQPREQVGFRINYSTVDHLHVVQYIIAAGLDAVFRKLNCTQWSLNITGEKLNHLRLAFCGKATVPLNKLWKIITQALMLSESFSIYAFCRFSHIDTKLGHSPKYRVIDSKIISEPWTEVLLIKK